MSPLPRIYHGAMRALILIGAYKAPGNRGQRAAIARRVRAGGRP